MWSHAQFRALEVVDLLQTTLLHPGIVSARVALVPRSTEAHPVFLGLLIHAPETQKLFKINKNMRSRQHSARPRPRRMWRPHFRLSAINESDKLRGLGRAVCTPASWPPLPPQRALRGKRWPGGIPVVTFLTPTPDEAQCPLRFIRRPALPPQRALRGKRWSGGVRSAIAERTPY